METEREQQAAEDTPQPETDSVHLSAADDEAAAESQTDGSARVQSPEKAVGFSMHDRRRFVNWADFSVELEEALEPETGLPMTPPSVETPEPTPVSWTEAELEPEAEAELDEEPEPSPWMELQQELRRAGRELSKNTRQAEVNLQIFGEVLDEIQRLPAAYSETVWQMKAGVLKELLGVVDGLEAGLRAGQETMSRLAGAASPSRPSWWNFFSSPRESVDAVAMLRQWLEGQQILYRRLVSVLHSQGVQEIESVGQRFDARLHRATGRQVRLDLSPGTIVTEEVKGYLLDGRILRYAEVVVASHEQNHRD